MKLNLEVELDWIDEEMNLDDTIKQNVINSVVNRIQAKVNEQVESKINKIIDTTIVDRINNKVDALFDEFTNKQIALTDGYGDKVKVYENVIALIKDRFDNFMEQPVDDNGKTYDSTYSIYGSRFKRVEFMIDKQLKDFANKFTADTVKRVSEEIKLHVADGLQTKLGSELMRVLKVDKMLELKK